MLRALESHGHPCRSSTDNVFVLQADYICISCRITDVTRISSQRPRLSRRSAVFLHRFSLPGARAP